MNSRLQFIVEYTNDKDEVIRELGDVKYDLPFINSYVLEVSKEKAEILKQICEQLHENTNITAQMNMARRAVNADVVTNHGITGEGVTICILDTGASSVEDFTKPQNRIIAFRDFVNGKSKPYDDNGHGTHVTGIAAGNGYKSNGMYMGIAPNANIVSLKILDGDGKGNVADVLAGLQWINDNHKEYDIRVVNLSIGTEDSGGPLVKAVEKLWDKGLIIVIAAGNNGPGYSSITSPGDSRKVITVGASDDNQTVSIWGDSVVNFSGRGPTSECIIKPDIVAPGSNIISCLSNEVNKAMMKTHSEDYAIMSGTSMSTPIITGAIALLLQKRKDLTPNEVKLRLKKSAVNLNYSANQQGWGLIDLKKLILED